MDIHIFNHQQDCLIDEEAVRSLASLVVAGEGQSADEVAVHFVTKEASGQIHDRYFSDPSPTDCMSFPMDEVGEDPRVLGEVFVCPAVAKDYCAAGGALSFDEELALYVIHSLLHLMGHDDQEDEAEAKMRERERVHLASWRATGRSVILASCA
jgi:probable rRNA maturation factor